MNNVSDMVNALPELTVTQLNLLRFAADNERTRRIAQLQERLDAIVSDLQALGLAIIVSDDCNDNWYSTTEPEFRVQIGC